ncbi:hypothetical protein BCR32DRAFT_267043 [Anaeromyces robustus]|uniref:Uncharacterized protein n=1 Tax=Anaeromyces robustus TaxID=1754192 RepID=A0A1Y1XC91_9FUNG|nr:hypothetical protein BCR32DRAFT_267043 [Anaeromyces robustus]|eukprot:ORX83390.1 hypothetical protein BCR32DRAFT_267043 [Anaeromyces robustus]
MKKHFLIVFLYLTLIKTIYCLYIPESSNLVNIYNVNTNLCLTYKDLENSLRLSNCDNNNSKQQWIVPESGSGYYISNYDKNICLYIKSNGIVVADICSKNKSKIADLLDSKDGQAISLKNDKTKCLGIFEKDKFMVNDKDIRKTDQIRVNMNSCNDYYKDQHWELRNISLNNEINTVKNINYIKKIQKNTIKDNQTNVTINKINNFSETKIFNKRALNINYTPDEMVESDSAISNPYVGWFHGAITVDLSDYPELDCNYIDKFYNVMNYKNGLQYLGVRLAEYKDREITNEGLAALDNLLNEYRKRKDSVDPNTQIILRFYYNGDENCKSDINYNVKLVSNSQSNNKRNVDHDDDNNYKFKQHDNDEDQEKNEFGTEKIETEEIEFYNDGNELKILQINNANEIEKEEQVLTMEEENKFENNEKYLNKKYLNKINKLKFTDNELKDYTKHLIFCNSDFNKKYFSENNNNNNNNNHINKRDDKIEDKISQKNATKSDFDKFKIHAAKVLNRNKYYNVCVEWSKEDKNVCVRRKKINKYCIYKYNAESDNLTCEKYVTEEVEPRNLDMIIKHIKKLSTVVNKYKDLIYIYQGAFIGKWGEMNNSTFTNDLDSLNKIVNTIEEYFDPSIYISVRTPRYYRGIMNKSKSNKNYQSLKNRLSLFNDGLFYNNNDYGTYGNSDINENNGFVKATRKQEVTFQNELCLTVPNGGEGVYNGMNDDNKRIAKEKIPELLQNPINYNNFYVSNDHARNIHLSYLDDDYHEDLFELWKETSSKYIYDNNWNVNGLAYIGNHLGYRYVLRKSSLNNSNNILTITVENVGYSPAYKKFITTLILVSSSNNQKIEINIDTDNRKWPLNNQRINLTVNLNNVSSKLTKGKYNVFFKMFDNHVNNGIRFGIYNDYYYNCYERSGFCGYKIGILTVK